MADERNWAGNITYGAATWHHPETVDAVRAVVRGSKKLRAVGTRHSFNRIADSTAEIVALDKLERVVAIDAASSTVTVEAGVTYGQLSKELERAGYALHNLASLPHISVVGACATATHGSGVDNGNLATAVTAFQLVTAEGEVVECSRELNGEQFQGMVVGLGALGVITQMTLELQPTYAMRQVVYENLPLAQLDANFDTIVSSGYSVSLFTDWRAERFNQVWIKRRAEDKAGEATPTFYGATLAATALHPIPGMSPENCTQQMGVVGPWYERLPHFRMEFTPSAGDELQTEYFISRRDAVAALKAVARLRERIAPLVQISEIRTIAADTLWMSPCYRRDSVGIHFTWVNDWEAVQALLPTIEGALEPFGARPHWGKLFTMEAARVQALYVKLPEFRALLRTYDPQGKFRNEFIEKFIIR